MSGTKQLRILPKRRLIAAIVAVAALLATSPGRAQALINVLVPFGPGGGVDLAARMVAKAGKPHFPSSMIVTNKPGAAGIIAMAEVMRANPDGKTLVLGTSTMLLQAILGQAPWTGLGDFAPVASIALSPNAHYVRADAPWKNLNELIAYSKANPGKVNYGSLGPQSSAAVRYFQLQLATSINWTTIQYSGDAQVLQAILGGEIETGSGGIAGLAPFVKAERIRLIAVPELERLPEFPDVPTFAELGYPVVLPNYLIYFAPKGTPDPALQALREGIRKALDTDEFATFARQTSLILHYRDGADFRKEMGDLNAVYAKIAPMLPSQ